LTLCRGAEAHEGVEKGKYTKGLGQNNMAFVGDREDIVSISLTATQNFLEKYNIDPASIGHLEVGTETIIDKAKSVKSYLIELFARAGNFDVEGVDCVNACYGGTAALLNAVAWVESRAWDGRLALVVAADIAVYARGNARPTGGCGAVVMLVGPQAALVMEPGLRGTHVEHAYDFYKPEHTKEYPTVDGKLSIQCYLKAVDHCYDVYARKFSQAHGGARFSLSHVDFAVFHSPYNGLVQKALARLVLNDFLVAPETPGYESVQVYKNVEREETYFHKNLETAFRKLSEPVYATKTKPTTLLPTELGNVYCGSLYAGLLSLVHTQGDALLGKRVLLFSYGSGMVSTLFSFKVARSVRDMQIKADLTRRLSQRRFVDPKDFHASLALREERFCAHSWKPQDPKSDLFPGTFYLKAVDDQYRRTYKRSPPPPPAAKL